MSGGVPLVKAWTTLLVVGLFTAASWADVSLQVYRADERTPLAWTDPNAPEVYEDIMVGTHLTFFIGSDTPVEWWAGGLFIPWDDWAVGTVAGRGYDLQTRKYERSILPSRVEAYVNDSQSNDGNVFSMDIMDFDFEPIAGEWFVLDYFARRVGTCTMGLYSSEPAGPVYGDLWSVPSGDIPFNDYWIQGLSLHHVPSRDYDGDTVVNFVDFAFWADQWQQAIAPEDPNEVPPGDLNDDAFVDTADLTLFCAYWLERTDTAAPAEPNPLDPNTAETGR